MMKKKYYKFMVRVCKVALLINSGFGKCINAFIRFLDKGKQLAKKMQGE